MWCDTVSWLLRHFSSYGYFIELFQLRLLCKRFSQKRLFYRRLVQRRNMKLGLLNRSWLEVESREKCICEAVNSRARGYFVCRKYSDREFSPKGGCNEVEISRALRKYDRQHSRVRGRSTGMGLVKQKTCKILKFPESAPGTYLTFNSSCGLTCLLLQPSLRLQVINIKDFKCRMQLWPLFLVGIYVCYGMSRSRKTLKELE